MARTEVIIEALVGETVGLAPIYIYIYTYIYNISLTNGVYSGVIFIGWSDSCGMIVGKFGPVMHYIILSACEELNVYFRWRPDKQVRSPRAF